MFYWANTERNHYFLHHCANINLEVIAHVSYEKAKCSYVSGPVWPLHGIEVSSVNFHLMLMTATSLPAQPIQGKH